MRPTYVVFLGATPEVSATHVARHTNTQTISHTDTETDRQRGKHKQPNPTNYLSLKITTIRNVISCKKAVKNPNWSAKML